MRTAPSINDHNSSWFDFGRTFEAGYFGADSPALHVEADVDYDDFDEAYIVTVRAINGCHASFDWSLALEDETITISYLEQTIARMVEEMED